MERVRGRPNSGLYLGGACLIFLAWLAAPGLTAGLPAVFYLLAACCCVLRLLSGPDRVWAAAWLTLSVLMVSSEAQWLAGRADLFLVQFMVGCLMIVPAFHWFTGTRSFFPPPECALAVLIVIAETVVLAIFMPDETLFSIGRFAGTGLSLIFLCWCCSIARASGMSVSSSAENHAQRRPLTGEAAAQQREILREVVRAARAHHAGRLRPPPAARVSGKPGNLGKAA